MIDNKELIATVNDEYLSKQNEKKFILYQLENSLFDNPDYYETAKQISRLELEIERAEYLLHKEEKDEFEKKLKAYQEKRLKLLSDLGYANYINSEPICKICKDTGLSIDDYCHCFFEKLTLLCYKELDVSPLKLKRFEDDTLSVSSGKEAYFKKLDYYAENFKTGKKNLIFTGKTGTGKTFLAQCVAEKISRKNFNVIYLSTFQLNNVFVDNMYSSENRKKLIYDILSTCDFLVLDDLGTERIINKITVENLLEIISERLSLEKPFLITTNLTPEEIQLRYGDRLFSRLTGKSTVTLLFDGKDLRKV